MLAKQGLHTPFVIWAFTKPKWINAHDLSFPLRFTQGYNRLCCRVKIVISDFRCLALWGPNLRHGKRVPDFRKVLSHLSSANWVSLKYFRLGTQSQVSWPLSCTQQEKFKVSHLPAPNTCMHEKASWNVDVFDRLHTGTNFQKVATDFVCLQTGCLGTELQSYSDCICKW